MSTATDCIYTLWMISYTFTHIVAVGYESCKVLPLLAHSFARFFLSTRFSSLTKPIRRGKKREKSSNSSTTAGTIT